MGIASEQLRREMEEENRQLEADERLARELAKRRSVNGGGYGGGELSDAALTADEAIARRLAYEEYRAQEQRLRLARMHKEQARVLAEMDAAAEAGGNASSTSTSSGGCNESGTGSSRIASAASSSGSARSRIARGGSATAVRVPMTKEERKAHKKEKKRLEEERKQEKKELKRQEKEARKRRTAAARKGSAGSSMVGAAGGASASPASLHRRQEFSSTPMVNRVTDADRGFDSDGQTSFMNPTSRLARRHASEPMLAVRADTPHTGRRSTAGTASGREARAAEEEDLYCVGSHHSQRHRDASVPSNRIRNNRGDGAVQSEVELGATFFTPDTPAAASESRNDRQSQGAVRTMTAPEADSERQRRRQARAMVVHRSCSVDSSGSWHANNNAARAIPC